MGFQGDVVTEDFAGPFPYENRTGCTFPGLSELGRTCSLSMTLEEHFRALGPVLCSIPGLEAKQRLLASLTH